MTKNCKYCKSEIHRSAKVCPQCGSNLRNWFIKHPGLTALGVLLGIIVGFGMTSTPEVQPSEGSKTPITSVTVNNLEVLEHAMVMGSYGSHVKGKVKNTSGKQLAYAQCEITFYNSQGEVLGSSFDNINNLEPNDVWNFKIMNIHGKADSYKIKTSEW